MARINLKDKAQPREAFLMVLVGILVVFTFFEYLYLPRAKKADEVKSRVDLVRQEKDILEKSLKTLKQQAQKTKKKAPAKGGKNVRLQILEGNIEPDIDTFNRFMQTVTAPSFLPGLSFESFVNKEAVSDSGMQRIPYYVVANGSFTRLTVFVDKIEKLPALVSIDSLAIESNPDEQGAMHLEMAGSYYQLEGKHALSF